VWGLRDPASTSQAPREAHETHAVQIGTYMRFSFPWLGVRGTCRGTAEAPSTMHCTMPERPFQAGVREDPENVDSLDSAHQTPESAVAARTACIDNIHTPASSNRSSGFPTGSHLRWETRVTPAVAQDKRVGSPPPARLSHVAGIHPRYWICLCPASSGPALS
jgi:hypothetical protein